MYARVTFAQVRPGELRETTALLGESLYPSLRQMQGFNGALLLTNPETEKVIGIALWETEADIPHIADVGVETSGTRRATRRLFEASFLERLATIPLVKPASRATYNVRTQAAASPEREPTRATVMTIQVAPGKTGAVMSILENWAMATLKRQEGFCSYLGLAEERTGECIRTAVMVVSLWKSEGDSSAWKTGYQKLAVKLSPHLSGPPTVEGYQVSAQLAATIP